MVIAKEGILCSNCVGLHGERSLSPVWGMDWGGGGGGMGVMGLEAVTQACRGMIATWTVVWGQQGAGHEWLG